MATQESLLFEQKIESLEDLKAEAAQCRACGLHEFRENTVFGKGNPKADLVIVGQGPGENEDRTGIPFSGRSGALLDESLKKLGIPAERLYFCNIVICRTPDRAPRQDEIRSCARFHEAQIRSIAPQAVLALGGPAAVALSGQKGKTLASLTGRVLHMPANPEIPLLASPHPAAVLRAYSGENRASMERCILLAAKHAGLAAGLAG